MIIIKDYIKFNLSIFLFVISIGFSGCNSRKKPVESENNIKELFQEVEPTFESHGKLILPEGYTYRVLFSEGDEVVTHEGIRAPAKGMHDCVIFIPEDGSSTKGKLFVSHEDIVKNDVLGHGGGGTIFSVEKKEGEWQIVSERRNIDFTKVGGTIRNCGGELTPKGTIISAEEGYANTNQAIYTMYPDTSDFRGKPRYMNFGYAVEIDPDKAEAIQKLKSMGRYSHEDVLCLEDQKTVYLTQDESPAIFYKFVAFEKGDYSKGSLYAYKQKKNGGEWLELSDDPRFITDTRRVALERGATLFNRHEWVTKVGDKLYITETGHDFMQWDWAINMGGVPADYFNNLKMSGAKNVFSDPYGRVLEFNMKTNEMKEYLAGGTSSKKPLTNFASPDCIHSTSINNQPYLVFNEDIIGLDKGRVSEEALSKGFGINEIYFLNANLKNPTVDDLKRFLVAPKGSETTGTYFTPDGKNMFLSIQHPDTTNPEPFNKSCVIVITGF